MRNFTLGALLLLTSVAAIAYVYQKPACPAGEPCPLEMLSGPEATAGDIPVAAPCEKCKGGVVDVVDLTTAYANSPANGTAISFEEPPYAKPRDVQPVQFEQPTVEIAPAPRSVK